MKSAIEPTASWGVRSTDQDSHPVDADVAGPVVLMQCAFASETRQYVRQPPVGEKMNIVGVCDTGTMHSGWHTFRFAWQREDTASAVPQRAPLGPASAAPGMV